jgi:hypothetical protein
MELKKMFRQSLTAFALFAGLTTSLVSCKKDKDDNDGGTPGNQTLHVKEFNNDGEFIRFRYNGAGKVDQVTVSSELNSGGEVLVYSVSYVNGKLDKLESTENVITANYENGNLTSSDMLIDGDKIGFTNFQYEANEITRASTYAGGGTDFELIREFIFERNNAGNIEEAIALLSDGEPGQLDRFGHVEFQYDQKTNPLYEHRDLLALFWQGVSKNNITREDHFDADLAAEDRYVYAYTYNDKSYPVTATVTQGLPGQPTSTSQVFFTYQ